MRAAYSVIKKIVKALKLFFTSIAVFIISVLKYFRVMTKRQYRRIESNNNTGRVLVMGNGPSLNDIDFERINRDDYILCCVNNYPSRSELFAKLKPEFLCLIDPGYYDFTTDAEKDEIAKLLSVLENVDWNLRIIAPRGKKLNISNPNISYVWINTNTVSKKIFDREKWWLYNNNIGNPGMQNVVLGALYFFLAGNYRQIFISGVDFSDFKFLYVDENNRVYVDSTHSYGSTRYYFDEIPEYGFNKFYKILGAYQKMFFDASKVREYADYKGIDIINLSLQSYIDSFEKKSPDVLYHDCKDN